jgi:hypothetical protein
LLRVVVDARDAYAPRLRGWGRYARRLVEALDKQPDIELTQVKHGWPGPEAAFELAGLPLRARGADVLHVPNCFLPSVRPCTGVVTIHDLAFEDHPEDFARRTARTTGATKKGGAGSGERVLSRWEFTVVAVASRYRVDPQKVHVIPEAPALATGDTQPPPGPYILGIGDLRK